MLHKDGTKHPLDVTRIRTLVEEACAGLSDVEPERIIRERRSAG